MAYSKEQFTDQREKDYYLNHRTYLEEFYGTFSPQKTQHISGTDRSVERLKIGDKKRN